MIIDKLENSSLYFPLGERFEKGFKFLIDDDLSSLPEGKHEIDGDNVFALVSNYVTRSQEEKQPESHKIYADIQYMVTGAENIGYAAYKSQEVYKEYDEDKDFMLYNDISFLLKLEKGMFTVFFPDDIHMPGITMDEPVEVKKIVIKVRL